MVNFRIMIVMQFVFTAAVSLVSLLVQCQILFALRFVETCFVLRVCRFNTSV